MSATGLLRPAADRPSRRLVLVPEIHPGNALLFWTLSWFVQVRAYRIHPRCRWLMTARLTLLDQERYFSADNLHCFRAEAVKRWEQVLPCFPKKRWEIQLGLYRLDMTQKILQELAPHFERLVLLREIQRQLGPERCAVVGSLELAYLRSLDEPSAVSWYPEDSILSRCNIVCEALWRFLTAGGHVVVTAIGLVRGLWGSRRQQLRAAITCLWDAVSPNELSLSAEKRSFAWVVDGRGLTSEDVAFIMPRSTDRVFRETLAKSSYRTATGITGWYRVVARRRLWQTLARLCRLTPSSLARALVSFEGVTALRYLAKILQFKPVLDELRPDWYVITTSSVGLEPPAIAYCRAVGIKTLMYFYSANVYTFSRVACRCDFRTLAFAHLLASCAVVWNRSVQRLLKDLPQDPQLAVEVIGPLMSGDERVLTQEKRLLRARVSDKALTPQQGRMWVTVFDVSTPLKRYRTGHGLYTWDPNYYTEAYSHAFLRDVLRLLVDCERLIVAFKPKRSLTGRKFIYSKETLALIEQIRRHPRGLILAHDLNPWVPIAIADVTVAMPFTSPVLAGWHYGIPGIFHDPLNVCQRHRYAALEGMLAHSYEELKANVQEVLFGTSASGCADGYWSKLAELIGPHPGENASDDFRLLLRGISKRLVDQNKAVEEHTAVVQEVPS